MLPHPIWKGEYVDGIKITHREPESLVDKVNYPVLALHTSNII